MEGANKPVKPESNLVWAILCTCLCCVPLGVPAIVYAAKVDDHYSAGRYAEAEEAARKAKQFSIWGACASACFVALYIVFLIVVVVIGASSQGTK